LKIENGKLKIENGKLKLEVIMNYPTPRGGIENPKDFQGGFCQKLENRKSEIRNGRGRVKKSLLSH